MELRFRGSCLRATGGWSGNVDGPGWAGRGSGHEFGEECDDVVINLYSRLEFDFWFKFSFFSGSGTIALFRCETFAG